MKKILGLLLFGVFWSCKSNDKYYIFIKQNIEHRGQGESFVNGIATDKGYLFIDTIWDETVKGMVVRRTLIQIKKQK